MERGQLLVEIAKREWLSLLRQLEREKGNALLALLEARRQRPDLWRIWNGEKPADTQMELFNDD